MSGSSPLLTARAVDTSASPTLDVYSGSHAHDRPGSIVTPHQHRGSGPSRRAFGFAPRCRRRRGQRAAQDLCHPRTHQSRHGVPMSNVQRPVAATGRGRIVCFATQASRDAERILGQLGALDPTVYGFDRAHKSANIGKILALARRTRFRATRDGGAGMAAG